MDEVNCISILPYNNRAHREPVISLWNSVFGYETAHNEPGLAIDNKLAIKDGLFFVALNCTAQSNSVIGSIMAGYDGHRGWIYSLAIATTFRGQGIGTRLLKQAESALMERGCVKINLQILDTNHSAEKFYLSQGYKTEPRISMGKRLVT